MHGPRFATSYQTALNGAIDASTTTVVVHDSPPTRLLGGSWPALIDAEIVWVTAAAGTGNKTLTVVRGQEQANGAGPAASHSDGATVSFVLTAESIYDLYFADLRRFGAVYGGVSSGTASTNLTALHDARDAVTEAGGGRIFVSGVLEVNDMCDFEDLGDSVIELDFAGGLSFASGIRMQGSGATYLFSLKGTRRFTMRGGTLDADELAEYALFLARTNYPDTAGKHLFDNICAFNATKASLYSYGSEDNDHRHCQYQRSPIGALITGYPAVADPTVVGSVSVDFDATWHDSTLQNFARCAFGSSVAGNPTPKAAIVAAGAQLNLDGAVIQTSPDGEAGIILDRSPWMSRIDANWDSGLPLRGMKIGTYTQARTPISTWMNTVNITGDMGISSTAGAHFIDAYNLVDSMIGPLSCNNLTANEIRFLDADCKNNVVFLVHYRDGSQVTVTQTAADPSNLIISRARFTLGADVTLYRGAANQLKTDDDMAIVGKLGVNGTAPLTKPNVTGSRGGNAALANLLTALENYGLITNGTS